MGDDETSSVLTWWLIEILEQQGQRFLLKPLAINLNGKRIPALEREGDSVLLQAPTLNVLSLSDRQRLLSDYFEPMLNRELQHQGLAEKGAFSTQLIGWVEIQGKQGQRFVERAEDNLEEQTFGKVILKARKSKGLSQRDLADAVELNFTYLSKLENDKADYPPKEEVIRSLARTLDLDQEELIYLVGRIPQSEEDFIRRHYDKIPTLFRRMQENPDFAQKVFYEAAQSGDEEV